MITKILISILVTCTPLLIQAQGKVIFIIPRQVRRVHNSGSPLPWHQLIRQPYMKATNYIDNEIPSSQSQPRPTLIQHHYQLKNRPPIYTKNVPHGGDNFDQGHEVMNHITMPPGKKVSHAISFGKGYIPHEVLLHHAGFSTIPNNKNHHHQHHHHHQNINQHSPGYSSHGPIYSPPHLTQSADFYYQNEEASQTHQKEVQERRADELALKFLNMKSIGKDGKGKAIIIPRGTPQSTIGSGKNGIFLQDTIALDNYNKEILELTNTWPKPLHSPAVGSLSTGIRSGVISQFGGASQPFISHPVNLDDYHGHAQYASSFNVPNSHQQQGYAVNEDTGDVPHDFRTAPIQTAPVQTNPQPQSQVRVQSPQHSDAYVHYQALESNIQAQGQALPGYFALAGLTGITHN